MDLRSPKRSIVQFLAWRVLWWASYLICGSLRFKVEGLDSVLERQTAGNGFILALWRGRTLLPIYYCRNLGFWAIISLSRDGEMQNRIVSRYGYRTIRGSSGKQGARAFLESVRRLREGGVLSVTPDGPKGPDREVQMGTLQLAQRSGCPVVPVGASARPRKLMGSWDSYMAPMPFGRAAIVFGDPILVPSDLTEDEASDWAARIQSAINDVEQRAEKLTLTHG
ncbi:MAG: lysophospholipid acyltransferase family protein [Armatimonadota bacterium]|nr:lysophospholipid acyltransferase family protein [Armatimonadota bacterium]